ncbi:MAG: UDP-2,4-diacetamido-2,4,6-trideoxy-beta-L-altropyranose hydrolase [Candidatus Hodarchaeota archaeon]
MKRNLVIRADANARMGIGHFMRCLALAQGWKAQGGKVTFITACQSEGLLQRLREEGFDIHLLIDSYPDTSDWDYTRDVLAAHPSAWVGLDGYHFDEAYHQQVKEAGHRLLVIDDMAHLKLYYADIVLNQNLCADQLPYLCEPDTRLLLGTRYVLLRREFIGWRGRKREIPKVARQVLVTLGGGDPENITLKVIQVLQETDVAGLEAIVVVGASNPHDAILEAAAGRSRIPIRLIRDARNMPELMAWADAAVSTAGTVIWELAWMGVPAVLLAQADNQRRLAEEVHRAGAAVNLGWAHRINMSELAEKLGKFLRDSETLEMMLQQMKTLVDGEGVSRVMMHMMGEKLRLRHVREGDCRLLWEWANEPGVRTSSFSVKPIPWEEHARWFAQKLNDSHCFHFIALDDHDIPVGQVRFDVQGEEAEIDISVDRQRHGHGHGSAIINAAVHKMFLSGPVKIVHAYVKPNNEASVHAFRRAGFRDSGIRLIRGYQAVHLIRVKRDE